MSEHADRLGWARVATPDGPFTALFDDDETVYASGWTDDRDYLAALIHPSLTPHRLVRRTGTAVAEAVREYYRGNLTAPATIGVYQVGGPFLTAAWNALRQVPPGPPVTYSELAQRAGNAAAVRGAAACCRPPSRGCLNPPFPTVGLTRQPSRDPGLPRATPGPHTGAHRPSLAIPWPLVVPLALGTPWRGAGTPVLVILSSPPTSRQEENLPTQRSPSSRASQAPPSPPTRPGLPLPMGFLHLRVLPGPGIRRCPGPRPFPTSTCTTTFGPPTAEIRG